VYAYIDGFNNLSILVGFLKLFNLPLKGSFLLLKSKQSRQTVKPQYIQKTWPLNIDVAH